MAKSFGLVLGSGAARGWAHIGVLEALEARGLRPDIITGCSVGALVGGAYLIDALEPFTAWARELKPLSAISSFVFKIDRGGMFDAAPAFEAFRDYDRLIEDLPTKFGAVAGDLGTGEEVWITAGSILDAARASSAIPVGFHAVEHDGRWLIDGAVANPTPVSLARHLGADIVVSVDLNAQPRVLYRFDPPPPGLPALQHSPAKPAPGIAGAVSKLIDDTRRQIDQQIALYKSRADATPYLMETALAAADSFQMHLSRANYHKHPADIVLKPDMRDALPTAFDRADEFIAEGKRAMDAELDHLEQLLAK